jgi:hypothetical protein
VDESRNWTESTETREAPGGLAAFLRGLPAELADRDLVWRRTDTVVLAREAQRVRPFDERRGVVYREGVKICLFIPVLLAAACGGAAPATVHKSPSAATPSSKVKAADPAPKEEEGRGGVQCDDGSCFACGEAICLSGFFCSVGKTGHGCAWLPTCSGRPSCGCITPSLREDPSCSCQEKEGGIYVTCDGAKL